MVSVSVSPARDAKVIGLIGLAHCLSHFFQLSLPALFPLMHAAEGLSYTALGFLTSVFFVTSGICQAPAGFLVDRIGARTVLIAGLALEAGAILLFGFTTSYPAMIVLAALAGLGNSIFHPADYSILSATVSEARIGRAFSMHGIGGFGGYAAAPVAMFALGTWAGWQAAMIAVGAFGLGVAIVLYSQRGDIRSGATEARAARNARGASGRITLAEDLRVLFQPAVVLCFIFFALTSMGHVGMMTLGPTALIAVLDVPLAIANGAVTVLLIGVVLGVLIGGIIADRHDRHDLVTALCVTVAAALYVSIPMFGLQGTALLAAFVVAGLFYGVTGPARDMVVRSISTVDSRGKVFGFTYSGLDFGTAVVAVLFGGLVDGGHARWVFVLMSVFMVLSVISILVSQYLARRAVARAGPLSEG